MKSPSRWSTFLLPALLLIAPAGMSMGRAPAVAAQGLNVLPLVNAQVGVSPLPPPVMVVAAHHFFAKGSGFRPGEAIRLSVSFPLYGGDVLTETRTAAAGSDGASAGVLMNVPNGTRQGVATLDASGEASKRHARGFIRVVYQPSIHPAFSAVRAGQTAVVRGEGWVPGSRVRASIIIPRAGQSTVTLSRDVTADGNGSMSAAIPLPTTTRPGTYAITALDLSRGLQATSSLTVSVRPAISLQPTSISPGGTVVVSGGGFPADAPIAVRASFPLFRGGSRLISATASTDSGGGFSARLRVPSNAAPGTVRITASGANAEAAGQLLVRDVAAGIAVAPGSVIPGQSVAVRGTGYPPADRVDVALGLTLLSGARRTISTVATADGAGSFTATLAIPGDAAAGTFTVVATSESSGRAPTAQLSIARLAPSVVALPTTAVPGTQVAVHGFGFAARDVVRIYLGSSRLGTALTDANGQFVLSVTIPADTASGSYTLDATAASGRRASIALAVNRRVSTFFYFPSEYTGARYANYLTLSNLTAIRARVTITYQVTNGTTQTKTLTADPHTRYTENVNADLGAGISAAAEVSADVPIAAEAVTYKGTDGAVVDGSTAPSTIWYFANGNTTHHYREFIAVQNPNPGPVQIAVHFLPTHRRAFTIYRTMPPTSRTTIRVGAYVRDAVGVTITANGPVVANRSIFIRHGITSQNAVTAPERTWYVAAGPQDDSARNWIAAINPSGQGVFVTLSAYGPFGNLIGTRSSYLRPNARAGYLINDIAHRSDAAVILTASGPVVAEQMTYLGKMHDASTDAFGVPSPAKSWSFSAVNTSAARGEDDGLDLFNPNGVPAAIVVQFIDSAGHLLERSYVVYPMYHQHIDVGSVEPNAQLALVAASNLPFVPLNRYEFDNGLGADTTTGVQG